MSVVVNASTISDRGPNWDEYRNDDGTKTRVLYGTDVNVWNGSHYLPFEDTLTIIVDNDKNFAINGQDFQVILEPYVNYYKDKDKGDYNKTKEKYKTIPSSVVKDWNLTEEYILKRGQIKWGHYINKDDKLDAIGFNIITDHQVTQISNTSLSFDNKIIDFSDLLQNFTITLNESEIEIKGLQNGTNYLDPSVSLNGTSAFNYDSYVAFASPTTNYNTNSVLWLDGITGGSAYRFYMQPNLTSLAGTILTDAVVYYTKTAGDATPLAVTIRANRVDVEIDYTTLNHNNQPCGATYDDVSSNCTTVVDTIIEPSGTGSDLNFNFTDEFNTQLSNTNYSPNYLIYYVGTSGQVNRKYASIESASSKPYINMTYLQAPSILVTNPNGSENIDTSTYINWTLNNSDNLSVSFDLQYSNDSGTTYYNITTDYTESNSSYLWNTTDLAELSTYLVKIIVYYDGTAYNNDVSDATFTILHNNQTEITNANFSYPYYGSPTNITVNLTDDENNNISWVNITVIAPNGTTIIDNENGTNLTGQYYWASTSNIVNLTNGTYQITVTAKDDTSGAAYDTFYQNITITDTTTYSPTETTINTNDGQIETFNISISHNSNQNFSYSFADDCTGFTTSYSSDPLYVGFGETTNLTVTINTTGTTADSYSCQINLTKNYDSRVSAFNLFVNVNVSNAEIFAYDNDNTTLCSGNTCDVTTITTTTSTTQSSPVWYIKNNGNRDATACNASFSGTLSGQTFVSWSDTNFNISAGESQQLYAIFTNSDEGSYSGDLDVVCTGYENGTTVSLGTTNKPSLSLTVTASVQGDTSGGGGGGGSVNLVEQTIFQAGNQSFTLKTIYGGTSYDLLQSPNSVINRELIISNEDTVEHSYSIICTGNLCDKLKISETPITVSANQDKTFKITVTMPFTAVSGQEFLGEIKAISDIGDENTVYVKVSVSKFAGLLLQILEPSAYSRTWFSAGGVNVPKWIVFFLPIILFFTMLLIQLYSKVLSKSRVYNLVQYIGTAILLLISFLVIALV